MRGLRFPYLREKTWTSLMCSRFVIPYQRMANNVRPGVWTGQKETADFILQNQLDPWWTQTLRKGETQMIRAEKGGREQEETISNLGQQSGRWHTREEMRGELGFKIKQEVMRQNCRVTRNRCWLLISQFLLNFYLLPLLGISCQVVITSK